MAQSLIKAHGTPSTRHFLSTASILALGEEVKVKDVCKDGSTVSLLKATMRMLQAVATILLESYSANSAC